MAVQNDEQHAGDGMIWKLQSTVVVQFARSKSGEDELVVTDENGDESFIVNEGWDDGGSSRVDVNENQPAFVYGALQAKKDSAGQIHVSVEPNINHQDSSCKFVCA